MKATYYGDGNGNWTQRIWADQCGEDILFYGQCQGVKGHEGDHWAYQPDGSYAWSSSEENLQPHDIAGGTTPPGHKTWVNPVEMADKNYLNFHKDSEVTDSELIDRLNRGEIDDDESLDQPVTDPKMIEFLNIRKCKKHVD